MEEGIDFIHFDPRGSEVRHAPLLSILEISKKLSTFFEHVQ